MPTGGRVGGNGALPFFDLAGASRYDAHIKARHGDFFLHIPSSERRCTRLHPSGHTPASTGVFAMADGARPTGNPSPTGIYIDANDDGSVCLLNKAGTYCLSVRPNGAVVSVPKVHPPLSPAPPGAAPPYRLARH